MTPKGKLLIIGGAEDKGNNEDEPEIKNKNKEFQHYEILKELLPSVKRKKRTIEVVTTASSIPDEVAKKYQEAFKKAGYLDIGFIKIETKEESRDQKNIDRVNNAHAVLFSGGDQFRLSTIMAGSPVIEAIKQKYITDEDFIVAGTSAGAMVMSYIMIYEGDSNEALLKGDVKVTSGFGFIDHCMIDTHFVKRGRFGRLAQAVITNPACIGIGLGEDTALIITKGNEAECRGSGMVTIIDGNEIKQTNIAYAEDYTPLFVENLKVHILARCNGFLLRERKFLPGKRELKLQKTGEYNS